MKKLVVVCCCLLLHVVCHAGIFSGLINTVKGIMGDSVTEIKQQNNEKHTDVMSELGVIKGNSFNAEAKLDATAQGIAGVNNKATEMRDDIKNIKTEISFSKEINKISNKIENINKTITKNTNQSNQASIFIVGFIAQTVVIMCLIGLLGYFISVSKARREHIDALKQSVKEKKAKLEGGGQK